MDLLFINHTENPTDYHALANSSHFAQAMDATGRIVESLSAMLQEYFPDAEIVVCVGNNDVVPDYYLRLTGEDSPLGHVYDHSMTAEDAGMLGVLYRSLSNNMDNTAKSSNNKAILNADDEWTFLRGGYYSRIFHDGKLILLSLNTVLYANYYAPRSMHPEDPGKQFLWMRKMLDYSRERNCRVIILGHIPPSIGSFRHTQLW